MVEVICEPAQTSSRPVHYVPDIDALQLSRTISAGVLERITYGHAVAKHEPSPSISEVCGPPPQPQSLFSEPEDKEDGEGSPDPSLDLQNLGPISYVVFVALPVVPCSQKRVPLGF